MKLCLKKFTLSLSIFTLAATAAEAIHDNLPAFDSSVKEFTMIRPTLFGEASRKAFVRRDKISVRNSAGQELDVGVSFLSGTGASIFSDEASSAESARRKLDEANFENVSGKVREDLSAAPFKVNPNSNFLNGMDMDASISLAQAASDVYLKFPLATEAFSNLGFNEQRYIVGLKSASKGVVLKNDKAILLAFRGTEATSITNWMTNAKFFQVPLLRGSSPKAHLGFYQAITELWPLVRAEIVSTLENKIRRRVQNISKERGGALKLATYGIDEKVSAPDERPIYFTGHSLGGAMATLIYAELTYNWLDHSNLGYYFVDPVLASLSEDQVNQLISDTIAEEAFTFTEENPRTFSYNEEADFSWAKKLTHLAVIENEARFSLTPVEDIADVTVDRRLKMLKTFGTPRSGDWFFKTYIEKYASTTGAQLVRFENFHLRSGTLADVIQADLVPRIPFGMTIIPEYSHVGTRASFETDEKDTQGKPEWLKCEYTNRDNERSIANIFDGHTADLKFSFGFHHMSLYLARIKSYKEQTLESEHTCSKFKYDQVL